MAVPAPGTATHPWSALGERSDGAPGTGPVLCEDADTFAGTALREATGERFIRTIAAGPGAAAGWT